MVSDSQCSIAEKDMPAAEKLTANCSIMFNVNKEHVELAYPSKSPHQARIRRSWKKGTNALHEKGTTIAVFKS